MEIIIPDELLFFLRIAIVIFALSFFIDISIRLLKYFMNPYGCYTPFSISESESKKSESKNELITIEPIENKPYKINLSKDVWYLCLFLFFLLFFYVV